MRLSVRDFLIDLVAVGVAGAGMWLVLACIGGMPEWNAWALAALSAISVWVMVRSIRWRSERGIAVTDDEARDLVDLLLFPWWFWLGRRGRPKRPR